MRVAARRGPFVEHSTLGGHSILVVEEEPFIARCVQVVLEGAGAEVYCAASAGEALRFVDQGELSAAVLNSSRSIKDGHAIAQRLAGLGVPFVFCQDIGRNEAWPLAPVLNKPISGADLVETLRRLLQPQMANAANGSLLQPPLVHSVSARGD
jgi:CheY-like chemotaxis protein